MSLRRTTVLALTGALAVAASGCVAPYPGDWYGDSHHRHGHSYYRDWDDDRSHRHGHRFRAQHRGGDRRWYGDRLHRGRDHDDRDHRSRRRHHRRGGD